MCAGILQFLRCIDGGEATDQVVPKEHLQMCYAVRPGIHEPHPRENDGRLQQQTCIQLPAQQLPQASFPDGQGAKGQCWDHPGRGALAEEAECQRRMHAGIATETRARTRGVEAGMQAQQSDRDRGQQRGVRGQPDRNLVGQEHGADRCASRPARDGAAAAAPQAPHCQRCNERIQKIRQTCDPRSGAPGADRSACDPIGQGRLFAEGVARQQRNRLVRLPAHAPGDVRLARFVGRPVTASEDAH